MQARYLLYLSINCVLTSLHTYLNGTKSKVTRWNYDWASCGPCLTMIGIDICAPWDTETELCKYLGYPVVGRIAGLKAKLMSQLDQTWTGSDASQAFSDLCRLRADADRILKPITLLLHLFILKPFLYVFVKHKCVYYAGIGLLWADFTCSGMK